MPKNKTKMVSVMRLTVTGRAGARVELAEEEYGNQDQIFATSKGHFFWRRPRLIPVKWWVVSSTGLFEYKQIFFVLKGQGSSVFGSEVPSFRFLT